MPIVREGDCLMPRSFRNKLLSLIVIGLATMAVARAQNPTAPATPPPIGGAVANSAAGTGRAQAIPGFNDVVATIALGNQKDKVTKGELINLLSRYPIADQNRENVYREGIDHVVNTKLLMLYLARQKVPVTPEKVDE